MPDRSLARPLGSRAGAVAPLLCGLLFLSGGPLRAESPEREAPSTATAAAAPVGGAPNVLVILIDTLRADHLGCYGYARPTSPHLDALAARGVRFEDAMSQASWTKPSIPTLFTGQYPSQHRVFTGSKRDDGDRMISDVLRPEQTTLAEVMKGAGYRTVAFVDNAQIRGFLGFDQGFDQFHEDQGDAMAIAGRFLEWQAAQAGAGSPYFAYLHMIDPHWPYTAPAEHAREFPLPSGTSIDFATVSWKSLQYDVAEGRITPNAADIAALQALYDAEIRYTDTACGRIFDALEKSGDLSHTIVLVTSDHGEEFFEHGYLGHGNHLHQELLHVPLLVAGPGVPAVTVDARVQLVDVLPTLAQLAGADPGALPEDVAGSSLVPFFHGGDLPRRKAFADHRPNGTLGPVQQCIAFGEHKLIRSYAPIGRSASTDPIPALEKKMWVEVEGHPGTGGEFVALDVEKVEAEKEMSLRGTITGFSSSGSFQLLGLPCRLLPDGKIKNDADERLDPSVLVDGTWISVRGRGWKDGVFQVFRVKVLDQAGGHDLQIKGGIEALGPGTPLPEYLQLDGVRILLSDDTDFEGFPASADAAAGASPATGSANPPVPLRERTPTRRELYDLSSDPREATDLAEANAEMAAALDRSLDQFLEAYERVGAEAEQELDAETVERLRSLGYIK